ncbi:hypothetical protein OBBRIDRAFT_794510 [Obba rivulosa]|uniref:Uncharacterized protein n=1 Tax=Obba rivulosa TaxID=1052685 RepID=A0A8E2DKS4_9APHY|nr:hypothetical protein OBBRIDRAFT_794510 [Obba rivulosa]
MDPPRHIPHTNEPPSPTELEVAAATIRDALMSNARWVHKNPASKQSVYTGEAGTLLMDWRIYSLFPSLPEPPGTSVCTLTSTPFSTPHAGSHASFLETSVGPATLLLIHKLRTLASSGMSAHPPGGKTWQTCERLLNEALEAAANEEISDDGCEVMYGRAGLLYAILLLREELSRAVSDYGRAPADNLQRDPVAKAAAHICAEKNVQALVDDIIERGRVGAKAYAKELDEEQRASAPALMWSWHKKRYLGGAHGVAGILQMLVSCPSRVIRSHWPAIHSTLEWLLTVQNPSGNWPSKTNHHLRTGTKLLMRQSSSGSDDELVQWCHGAPGVLIMLSLVLRRCRRSTHVPLRDGLADEIANALERGGALVYERGFLRKGVGLCHGVGGNVYALLAVSDVLDRPKDGKKDWLARATHFALLATSYRALQEKGEMHISDSPYSLYEGVAGMCCAWAEVAARLTKDPGEFEPHGMLGYDDLLPTTMSLR